jgi:hypothetical protein
LQLAEPYELCDYFFYWLRTFVKNSLRSLLCQEPRILEFRGYKRTDAKTGQRVIWGLAIAPISSFLCLVASLGSRHGDNEFEMLLDWTSGPLAEGLRCYQKQDFFDAHEHWEGVWLGSNEPEKTFLQALIQVTAAFHHLNRGNRVGTGSLLLGALRRLDGFPSEYEGVAVESLRVSIRGWLEALDLQDPLIQLPYPLIR